VTAPKPVRLTSEALHRIRLAAKRWPEDLELAQLRRALSRVVDRYHSFDALSEIRTQKARLNVINKTASKLAALLRDDEKNGILNWYVGWWPKDSSPPSKVVEEIQWMLMGSGALKSSAQKIMREIKDESAVAGSAFEWLVAKGLADVFQQLFRADPTVYRKGRYLNFALQVLTEFEITNQGRPYSRETIIRELTRARSGRGRRRHGGQK
jgi:hypothetical protein